MQFPLPLPGQLGPEGKAGKTISRRRNSMPARSTFPQLSIASFCRFLPTWSVEDFELTDGATILDPFCGTGTIEIAGIPRSRDRSQSLSPLCCVKTDKLDPSTLLEKAEISHGARVSMTHQLMAKHRAMLNAYRPSVVANQFSSALPRVGIRECSGQHNCSDSGPK